AFHAHAELAIVRATTLDALFECRLARGHVFRVDQVQQRLVLAGELLPVVVEHLPPVWGEPVRVADDVVFPRPVARAPDRALQSLFGEATRFDRLLGRSDVHRRAGEADRLALLVP